MVRYRPEASERGYTFRLNSTQPPLSTASVSLAPNSAVESTVHKERIDSLFRSKTQTGILKHRDTPKQTSEQTTRVNASGKHGESTLPVATDSRIYTRSKSFHEARTAVRANIEKIVLEKANPSQNTGARTTRPPPLAGLNPKQNVPLPPIPRENQPRPEKPPRNLKEKPQEVSRTSTLSTNKENMKLCTTFKVNYLGSLTLQEKATDLDGLQRPLMQIYLKYRRTQTVSTGTITISESGLRLQYLGNDRAKFTAETINPFSTIAVWAAVKFALIPAVSSGARFAFVPLISDPENAGKQTITYSLTKSEYEVLSSGVVHPPMFSCVMRNMTMPHVLECHAFVCNSAEDAVNIAANLYQALLHHMKTKKTSVKPRETEHVYSPVSIISNQSEDSTVPVRPPRRKKQSRSAQVSVGRRRSLRSSMKRTHPVKVELRRSVRNSSQRGRVQRSVSERQFDTADGDILTKVAIPRSKSFMNVPQNYSFDELFHELKTKEGIKNIDDAFKLILNRDKMSFNELKPAHKELIMKLALTLSKDEIFQRSKNVMRSHTVRDKTCDSADEQRSNSRLGSVLRATKKSFSRWGIRSTNGYSVASKQTQLQGSFKPQISAPILSTAHTNACKLDNDQFYSEKCYCSLKGSKSKDKAGNHCCVDKCGSADRCYCSLKSVRRNGTLVYQINLDTDSSATCSEDEKAPVSTGNNKNSLNTSLISWTTLSGSDSPQTAWKKNSSTTVRKTTPQKNEQAPRLRSYLSDTSLHVDSCDSAKPQFYNSYKQFAKNPELLRQRSSSSVLSGTSMRKLSSESAGYHSSHSTSSDNVNSVSSNGSSNSSSDRSLKSQTSAKSNKTVLLVSAVDPKGKLVYRGSSHAPKANQEGDLATIKKTAEIAALFSNLKMNQTTDILVEQCSTADETESQISADDSLASYKTVKNSRFPTVLGNSLGYLP